MKNTPTATRLNRKIVLLLTIISVLMINSCNKNLDLNLYPTISTEVTSEYLLNDNLTVFLQSEQIFRHQGKPGVNIIPIGMDNLSDYENCFVLNVASGAESAGTVSSAIIELDGREVLKTSNFSNKEVLYKYEICNLSKQSVLEVDVRGTPGSYLDIWIEGSLKKLTVTDCEGNVYKTINIGNQIWMAENLKTIKFNDCTDIPLVADNTEWSNLTTPGYCWVLNDVSYKNIYGAYYNYFAINSGKLCPTGWHVPSLADLTELITYVGGEAVAGLKLKSTSGWMDGGNGTDVYGFNGLPGSDRNGDGTFSFTEGLAGSWWTSNPNTNYYGMHWSVGSITVTGTNLKIGMSVRCIKDN